MASADRPHRPQIQQCRLADVRRLAAAAGRARLRRRGGARRGRGGPQRVAGRAGYGGRRRHDRGARRSREARDRGGLQGRSDRHRARHGHRRDRQASFRGNDAAQGRRNLWPACQGRIRPRLESRRRAARLHDQRAVRDARWHRLRLCRRPRRSCSSPRAVHRRPRKTHRGRLLAHFAVLPLSRRLWRRTIPTPPAWLPALPRGKVSTSFRASACAWSC